MEITKDNYFDIRYNGNKDVLEMPNSKRKKSKFIVASIGVTFILTSINLYLIYKFFDILCTI